MFCPCVLSHFSIVIASLREERADLCAFRAFVPLHPSVRDWLRLVIVALLAFSFYFLHRSKVVRLPQFPLFCSLFVLFRRSAVLCSRVHVIKPLSDMFRDCDLSCVSPYLNNHHENIPI